MKRGEEKNPRATVRKAIPNEWKTRLQRREVSFCLFSLGLIYLSHSLTLKDAPEMGR